MIALLVVLLLGGAVLPAHAQQLPTSVGQETPGVSSASAAGGSAASGPTEQPKASVSGSIAPASSAYSSTPAAGASGTAAVDPVGATSPATTSASASGSGVGDGGSSSAGASPPAAAAAPKPEPGSRDLPSLLGLTLTQAFTEFAPPEEVFPLRGAAAWQDDVVFYYPDHSYLFWFRDRVWQVRVDRRFDLPVLGGITIGSSIADVESILGTPFHTGEHSLIFILPDQGYPVRARLFFENDKLIDLYVYRGDF